MCLILCLVLNKHLYLGGVWLGLNLRINTKKTCVETRLDYVLNHSRHSGQYNLGDIYDYLSIKRMLTFTINRTFIQTLKITRKATTR